jgi:hypothetical protein
MELGLPSPEDFPMGKLALHELTGYGMEAKEVAVVVDSLIEERLKVMRLPAKIGGA